MESNQSRELQWFVNTLQNEFSIKVDINDIGVEATELGIDEVEDFFVPRELFDELPYTLIYEIMIVDDEENNGVQLLFIQIVLIGVYRWSRKMETWFFEMYFPLSTNLTTKLH